MLFEAASCPNQLLTAKVEPGYCASIWNSSVNVPRAIITASNGDVIVVETGIPQLSLFYSTPAGWHKVALASAPGLNHAVLIHENYIYASSPSTVYRWPYIVGTRSNLGNPQTVITGIPTTHHTSRTLLFDSKGNLLVQCGSGSNVDPDDSRAGIRLFSLATFPQTFSAGQWFARGLRNEVGILADQKGNIWGVENGMDDLFRQDLGGDIHNGNPGEELNLFATVGASYGYPYCFSQYNLSTVNTPRNTQYVLPQFDGDGVHSDKWCQNTSNVVKPAYQFHPHTAPLSLLFYYGTTFPGLAGDLLVTLHGSWDSTVPVGYSVNRVHFQNGMPISDSPFLSYVGPGATGNNWHRPVGITLAKDIDGSEMILVTSDSTNAIISIKYIASKKGHRNENKNVLSIV